MNEFLFIYLMISVCVAGIGIFGILEERISSSVYIAWVVAWPIMIFIHAVKGIIETINYLKRSV